MPRALTSTLIDVERAGGRLIAVGERGHVLFSDDRGEHWQQGKMPFRRMLTGVHFVDAQRGWASGYVTTTSGRPVSAYRVSRAAARFAVFGKSFANPCR